MSPVQTICACAKLPNKEMNVASIPISFKKTLPGAGNTGLCRFYTPCGDPIPTPKARHREFREPGRSCGAEGMVRNFPATDILPESPKRRVLRWHARKRKRGPLSETPFPLAKKPLTLAGSNPSNTDNDAERRAGRLGVGARSRHLVFEVVATAAVVDAGLVAFVAFCARECAFVLRMRIGFVAAFGLLDHGVVVAVAVDAYVVVAAGLDLHVGRMARLAFEAALHMAVGKELAVGRCDKRRAQNGIAKQLPSKEGRFRSGRGFSPRG